LAGARLVYRYSTGRRYHLDFTAERVTFALESQPGVWGASHSLPYRARKLRDGFYLIHWLPPHRTIHVTLLIDVNERRVHGSALLPDKVECFDIATIEELRLEQAR
jgi:phenolic acid decarboxylase